MIINLRNQKLKFKSSTPPISSPPFRRGGRRGGEFLSYKL